MISHLILLYFIDCLQGQLLYGEIWSLLHLMFHHWVTFYKMCVLRLVWSNSSTNISQDFDQILFLHSLQLLYFAGLCTLVVIILYIGAITEEVGGKKSSTSDPKFRYYYGTSFMLIISSFIVSELTGVLSVYLYISRHKHAYKKKQERMTMLEANERPQLTRYRRSRSHSGERGREYSRDNSPAHSDSYYTYTPVSDTSKEMSNYTLPRDTSRHTISTTADTHISKDHSVHSVRDMDSLRRTTPV